MIDIRGLNKADVLKELYNNSIVKGLAFLQATGRHIEREEAEKILEKQTKFDCLYGKVMKVDLSSDEEFEEFLYDRDNGIGSAKKVVDKLKINLTIIKKG